ncbi:mannonate dehydratase [Natronobiforma cellulositropha]|uniref:mannonate dehydratase n=1 Tax=Natronobiforma cellulositropha TaxID=1679076 RepID=UPI0021D5F07A|nr:mannonate dehydratase [Natronobiforma cellulositropha]
MTEQSTETAAHTDGFEDLPMRVGLGQFMQPTRERLRFIEQLGVEDVILNMYETPLLADNEVPLTGDAEWDFQELVQLRTRVEDAGLRLAAIENLPISFYDDVMLGREGRDEQLECVKTTIRNIGRAGIPVLGYHWSPSGVWRTTTSRRVRGDAISTGFDAWEVENAPLSHGREYTDEELWANYEYFLEAVLPVAEEAGVTLALHPNDPPVDRIGGMPFLFRDFENFKRAMDLVESDNHGLEFCLGTWSEMGEDLFEVIEYFGERDELVYVHFRDVEGTLPSFTETFIDEGNYDEFEIVRALDDAGFSGVMIPDHVPRLEGDGDWKHRGRAYTVGYLKGMLRSL